MKARLLILLAAGLGFWSPVSAQVNPAWAVRYRGPAGSDSVARAMVLDSATNLIVTGGSYGEYATVKYDRNGNEIWEARYQGPGLGDNFARATVVDGADNIYITGHSFGASNNFDYATVKYDPNGNQLWVARYSGPENTNDFARALAVDKAGNVYVTGTSAAQMDPFDEQGENGAYTTIKYDTNGNQLWVACYRGESDDGLRDSQAYAIALDLAGNVYVTGYSTGSGSFYDYCTIKYDANGNQLWLARYDGPAHGLDEASSLAVDSAGNVYVTGGSNGLTSYDYATVKYDTDGHQLWVARYNGPADYIDEAWAIAVDKVGNVHVTGSSAGSSQTDDDMATIKYDPNGNELWVARYGSTRSDKAFAIALDTPGNVYVAGSSDAGFFAGGFNYETVKYDANGNRIWAISYAGTGCVEFGSDLDVSWAVTVDGAGDVYVTGQTSVCFDGQLYATIKYTEGSIATLPPTIVDQPQSQTVVAGQSAQFSVYVSGTPPLNLQWQFNGANLTDATNWTLTLTNVQATNGGDYRVIVTNSFGMATSVVAHLTVQLTPPTIISQPKSQTDLEGADVTFSVRASGASPFIYQWFFSGINLTYATNSRLTLTNVQVVNSGDYWVVVSNPYGAATSSVAQLTIQLSVSPGVQQAWASRYNIPLGISDAAGRAIAVDSAGNVYVTGLASDSGRNSDYVTLKYDPSGNQIWAARYDGLPPGMSRDGSNTLAVDPQGNVYVTGGSQGSNAMHYATIKYDPNGNELWVARYKNLRGDWSVSLAMALDSAGNLYVTGLADYTTVGLDLPVGGVYATLKYDSNGNQLWVARHSGPQGFLAGGPFLALDATGNVFVAGISRPTIGSTSDYLTLKYDPNGKELWAARYNGPGHSEDVASALAVDKAGNVYVTGSSLDPGTYADYATVKYDANGSLLWVSRYNSPGDFIDWANAIAIDAAGNVYVTGRTGPDSSGNYNYATVKYDANGSELWAARYASGEGTAPSGMVLDSAGNVYVSGSYILSGNSDFLSVKYDARGNQMWVARYPHGFANAVTLDSAGNCYVTGASAGDFMTIKYVQTPTGPRLSSPLLLPNGQFQFTLLSEPGKSFQVQVSPDLKQWLPLTNLVNTTGTFLFTDSLAPNFSRRFYRVVSP